MRLTNGPIMIPLSRLVRQVEREQERESMRGLMRQEGASESLREVLSAISSGDLSQASRIPAIFQQAMQDMGGHRGDIKQQDLIDQDREQVGYGFASLYLQDLGQGAFKLWDFAQLLAGMVTLERDIQGHFKLDTTEEQFVMNGPERLAFERYLTFMGIYESLQLRKVCPVCDDPSNRRGNPRGLEPGQDFAAHEFELKRCRECGGLGWILDDRTEVE